VPEPLGVLTGGHRYVPVLKFQTLRGRITERNFMQAQPDGEITRLLGAFKSGDPSAESRLMELTYRELRKIAAGHLRRERSGRSLQTADLVHEAYLRLVNQTSLPWRDRSDFFRIAAHVMRQILVDRARKRHAVKRGGGAPEISLDRALNIAEAQSADLLALEEALARLERVDTRQCQVVEMRFFAGMSEDEVAEVLGVSARTINRDWRMARAWLYKEVYR
jgi:RNA polymerase sigma-70 factor (ECF subfamily)